MVLDIDKNEHGLIRVFAVNRAPSEMTKAVDARGKADVAAELIGRHVPDLGIELFPVADLSGVGLSGYLADGYDVPNAQLGQARSKLDRLDGYVLLLFSSAFEGAATTLHPGPDLTLIGTFGEAQPDMTARPLESEAAKGNTATPSAPTPPADRSSRGGSLVVAGLIALGALILWWILS